MVGSARKGLYKNFLAAKEFNTPKVELCALYVNLKLSMCNIYSYPVNGVPYSSLKFNYYPKKEQTMISVLEYIYKVIMLHHDYE
ncbi:hypothetical protein NC653_015341 [Populus alba x Populus x berolinensis]|uniref:Uncharacterized protein n=1 Tax=Populus alba x Populus x berolinensis TaxID=444605 RepID=A0AAD6QK78_9ROSI|nr:hypothetical protein NC653_015341 [Populus alba x Populus x berolinensis]